MFTSDQLVVRTGYSVQAPTTARLLAGPPDAPFVPANVDNKQWLPGVAGQLDTVSAGAIGAVAYDSFEVGARVCLTSGARMRAPLQPSGGGSGWRQHPGPSRQPRTPTTSRPRQAVVTDVRGRPITVPRYWPPVAIGVLAAVFAWYRVPDGQRDTLYAEDGVLFLPRGRSAATSRCSGSRTPGTSTWSPGSSRGG